MVQFLPGLLLLELHALTLAARSYAVDQYLIEELVHIRNQCWVVNNAQPLVNRV